MKIIEVSNLSYNNGIKTLFHNMNLDIEEGSFVSIVGENSCGKTTLLKLLTGKIIGNYNIKIDNVQSNKFNAEEISKKISFINSYNEFLSKTVLEEILQDKKNVSVFEINKVKKLLDEFNLLYLIKTSVQDLSYAENQIVALIKAIINKPKIIVLDNAFSKLDMDKRNELIQYISKYAKENKITVLFSTNNMEELKYSDRVLLIKYSNIFFDGTYNEFIKSVDLNKEGLKYPWEIDVSNKLMLYELIDREYDNIDDIVGELC